MLQAASTWLPQCAPASSSTATATAVAAALDQRFQNSFKRLAEAQRLLSRTQDDLAAIVQDQRKKEVSAANLREEEVRMCFYVFRQAKADLVGIRFLRSFLSAASQNMISDGEYELALQAIPQGHTREGQFDIEDFLAAYARLRRRRDGDRGTVQEPRPRQQERLERADSTVTDVEKPEKKAKESSVMMYLHTKQAEHDACLQLPWAIVLFLCFALACMQHLRMEEIYGLDHAITKDIQENAVFALEGIVPYENGRDGHKNLYDVNIIPDFWSWFSVGMVPLWWPSIEDFGVSEARANVIAQCTPVRKGLSDFGFSEQSIVNVSMSKPGYMTVGGATSCPDKASAEPLPDDVMQLGILGQGSAPTYRYFNTIVGGARLQQERGKLFPCSALDFRNLHKGDCVRAKGLYWLQPEIYQGLEVDVDLVNRSGGETTFLLAGWTPDQVRQTLHRLEDSAWFSPLTEKIEVLYTTYNPHVHLLTCTFVYLWQNRGGHIYKVIEPISIWIDPYHDDIWCYIFDICWLAMVVKLFAEEFTEASRNIRKLGINRGIVMYMSWSNAMDWITVGYAVAIVAYWANIMSETEYLRVTFMKTARADVLGSWEDPQVRSDYFETVHKLVTKTYDFRICLAVFPFVIVGRFMKAFGTQARLSVVTKTLRKSALDIAHFGVVFFTIFTVFVVSALLLFGKEDSDFANFARAFHTTFRVLLGDFDWHEFSIVGRPQAYLWFWFLIWLVQLLMLNMMVAIVLDVYTEVRAHLLSGSKAAPTIWEQSLQHCQDSWKVWRGEVLEAGSILKHLREFQATVGERSRRRLSAGRDKLDSITQSSTVASMDVSFTSKDLMDRVPALKEDQAIFIIREALEHAREAVEDDEKVVTLETVAEAVEKIGSDVQELCEAMNAGVGLGGGMVQRGGKTGDHGTLGWPDPDGINGDRGASDSDAFAFSGWGRQLTNLVFSTGAEENRRAAEVSETRWAQQVASEAASRLASLFSPGSSSQGAGSGAAGSSTNHDGWERPSQRISTRRAPGLPNGALVQGLSSSARVATEDVGDEHHEPASHGWSGQKSRRSERTPSEGSRPSGGHGERTLEEDYGWHDAGRRERTPPDEFEAARTPPENYEEDHQHHASTSDGWAV